MNSEEEKKDNPLDEGLAFVAKTVVSPQTLRERTRLGRGHQDFIVDSSAVREVDRFLQSLVKPLKATGRPLYSRLLLLTGFCDNYYDSSGSIQGHLVDKALETLAPSMVRQSLPYYQFGYGGTGFEKEDVKAEERRV